MTSRTTTKENHAMRTTLGGVALLLTIAAAASGCSDSDDNTTPPPSTSATPTTSAPTPQTPEEKATAAAETAIKDFFEVRNAVAMKPKTYNRLEDVAVGTVLVGWQNQFRHWSKDGWHATDGGITVTKMRTDEVALASKPPTVKVTICTGVSGDVVDRDGASVVSTDRPEQLTTQYTVGRYGGTWKVAVAQDQAVGSCTL
jgi:hypothetical protein